MKFIPIALVVLLFSCNSADKKNEASALSAQQLKDSVRACILDDDAVINKQTAVQYVVVDSFYTVKLKVNGMDSTLAYQFNCSTPPSLIPVLSLSSDSAICLQNMSAQDHKTFLIAYPDNNKLAIKNYEIALTTQLNNSIVIYQDEKSSDIVKENFRTEKKQHYSLPDQYHLPVKITKANILTSSNQLRLEFSNDKKLTIKL
jgi:hypothetical protein